MEVWLPMRGNSSRATLVGGSSIVRRSSRLAQRHFGGSSLFSKSESSLSRLADRKSLIGTWTLDENEELSRSRSDKNLDRLVHLKRVESRHMQEEAKKAETQWIRSPQADIVFALVIIASAIVTGVDVNLCVQQPGPSQAVEILLLVLNCLFLLAFLLELALRVRQAGLSYISPCNPSGCLDATVILVGFAEVLLGLFGVTSAARASGALRVFRLLRLLRMVRFVFVCKELRMLAIGLMASFSAVFWAMSLILVLMYFGALYCVILLIGVLEVNTPSVVQYFGSVWLGLWTHFQIVTLEAWPNICDAIIEATGTSLWAVYFVIFISITSLSLLNLVTGIVCEKLISIGGVATKDWATHDHEAYSKKVEKFRRAMVDIFDDAELNRYDKIDAGEFNALMMREDMRSLLREFEITTSLESSAVWDILDTAGDGQIPFTEFLNGLLRLRGSQKMPHSLMIQRDLIHTQVDQAKQVKSCEARMKSKIAESMERLEGQVAPTLEGVEKRLFEVRCALRQRESALQQHEKYREEEQSKPWYDINTARFDLPVGLAAFETHATKRLEALLSQLDGHCACAAELLTSKQPSPRRRHVSVHASCKTGVSKAAQTDSSIDFIEGLAGAGSYNRARISI